MNGASHAGPFTSAEALATLADACQATGQSAEGATLMRLGENAIFRLARDPVVVRIARDLSILNDAKKEVAVASWLRNAHLPAAETAERSQPIIARRRPVTFWKLIDDSETKATVAELGTILRRLHALPVPGSLRLPELDLFGRVADRVGAADITDADRSFLTERLRSLRARYQDLRYALPPSAVHGDAHQSNLIKRRLRSGLQEHRPLMRTSRMASASCQDRRRRSPREDQWPDNRGARSRRRRSPAA
ncbi:MAG TPA: phosphotransferase [Streptosporangiaceae bacterium]|nr:phosphotransferase [Streptosporangiaceae bacterium]